MKGVRGQLNVLVAATTSMVLVAFLVPLGLLLRDAAEQRALAATTTQAQSVAMLVALGQTPPAAAGTAGARVTVFYADGRSAGVPSPRTASVNLAQRGRAFTAQTGDGIEALVPVQGRPEGTAVVRAFTPEPPVPGDVLRTWAALVGLGVVLFGVSLLVADRMGRRLVRSVAAVAVTADLLTAGQLDARVEPSETPELRRVGVGLNRLAARIQELLRAEREEVADLAHRLRTPVTALRLDVDSIRDPADRTRLSVDVDALTRGVDEVIRTARRAMRERVHARADLTAVTAERTAFWSALAEDSGRPTELVLPPGPIVVRTSTQDLAAAIDALLENVFSHTPDGTAMRIEVAARADGGGQLTVDDAGPGITPRTDTGPSQGGSTGLGLDIARRTAEAAGGSLLLGAAPLGGARVQLLFPAPAPAEPRQPAEPAETARRAPRGHPAESADSARERPSGVPASPPTPRGPCE